MNAIAYFDPDVFPISGTVKMHQCSKDNPTRFQLDLKGLKPDTIHAIHVHEYGNISGGCCTAGGHYNPENCTHGSYIISNRPRHAGDLINNIKADEHGKVKLEFFDEKANLLDFPNIIGRTIVIHVGRDDLGVGGLEFTKDKSGKIFYEVVNEQVYAESLKTGNAGDRKACAVIGIDELKCF